MFVYQELHVRDIPRILVTSSQAHRDGHAGGRDVHHLRLDRHGRAGPAVDHRVDPRPQRRTPGVFLLFTNVLMLIVGMFIDATPAMITFTPILLSDCAKAGDRSGTLRHRDGYQAGSRLCHAPVGSCLFVASAIGGTTIDEVFKPLLPFLGGDGRRADLDHLLARDDPLHSQDCSGTRASARPPWPPHQRGGKTHGPPDMGTWWPVVCAAPGGYERRRQIGRRS